MLFASILAVRFPFQQVRQLGGAITANVVFDGPSRTHYVIADRWDQAKGRADPRVGQLLSRGSLDVLRPAWLEACRDAGGRVEPPRPSLAWHLCPEVRCQVLCCAVQQWEGQGN